MTLKERIMEATIDEFNEKGVKFTMDDLAKRLTMSKKTIYKVFIAVNLSLSFSKSKYFF